MTTPPSIHVPYVELNCFTEETARELSQLSAFDNAEGLPFAVQMSYYLHAENGLYLKTTNILAGHPEDGSVAWTSPSALIRDIAMKTSLTASFLMNDWMLSDLMTEWLPVAETQLKLQGEAVAICLPGGVLIENGECWPYADHLSVTELQKMVDNFLIVVMNQGLTAHEQMAFLNTVQAYLKKMIASANLDPSHKIVEAVTNLTIAPREAPYELRDDY